ncbi:hypothetical protein [Streptomyces sp. NPDC059142]|uniref:hypothetical protein n=1 Tax=Streptomyces sp. NPDC059142 TaxID=3346739 RepID=UPI0036CB975C
MASLSSAAPPRSWFGHLHRPMAAGGTGRDARSRLARVRGVRRRTTRICRSTEARGQSPVPVAHVVNAFNLCHEGVWRMRPPVLDGRPLAVPVCGDDEVALAGAHELVGDLGCEPVAGGGLERAGLLEATAALFIAPWVGEGADAQTIAPPLTYAAGPSRRQAESGTAAVRRGH